MSDEWERLVEDAIDAGSLLDKPDINDYLYDYEPEWLDAWQGAPVEEMTEGQIMGFIDVLSDMEFDEWPDFYDTEFDYWDWFREAYGAE